MSTLTSWSRKSVVKSRSSDNLQDRTYNMSSVSRQNSRASVLFTKKISAIPRKQEEDVPEEEPTALALRVLPEDLAKQLLEMGVEDMHRELGEFLALKEVATNLQEAAKLDYYTSAVWWAKEMGFTVQQTDGFFAIMCTLLNNVAERKLKLVENLLELKKIMVSTDTQDTGDLTSGVMELFNKTQAEAISKYILDSLFQHHKLFEYVFSEPQEEEIRGNSRDIEVAQAAWYPFPPPLDEGLEEDKYNAFFSTRPPSPTDESGEKSGKYIEEVTSLELGDDVFSKLTAHDVKEVVEGVASDMLGGLKHQMAARLRDKENQMLKKINKLHFVLSKSDKSRQELPEVTTSAERRRVTIPAASSHQLQLSVDCGRH